MATEVKKKVKAVPKTNVGFFLSTAVVGAAGAAYLLVLDKDAGNETGTQQQQPAAVHLLHAALSFIWLGLVLGISFLESWVKFRAELITRTIGLDVGRNVFHALNRVEVLLALMTFLLGIKGCSVAPSNSLITSVTFAPVAIVTLQVLWLQPKLDARARTIIKGGTPPAHWTHQVYVLLEVAKVHALACMPFLIPPFSGLVPVLSAFLH